ncbi:MAG: AI-2E family transporter [Gammaproteobacteria bacterium]|nr:AI-2E family transporter [Gammaproteobacteria bacterium]
MWEFFKKSYKTYFAGQESGFTLFLFLLAGLALYYLGTFLFPFFVAVFISFLLNELVTQLKKRRLSHLLSVAITFILFLTCSTVLIFMVLPFLWQRTILFVQEFPSTIEQIGDWLYLLPESYPELFSSDDIDGFVATIREQLVEYGQTVISASLTSIGDIAGFFVYILLVLVMVFFILKDYDKLTNYLVKFLPEEHKLMSRLGTKMKREMLRYIWGKLLEGFIVFVVSVITFSILGLNFTFLLAIAVGVSVIIPYIGAAIVTIPVLLVAYAQFGAENMFYYVLIAYLILQLLDGYILVPLLFSELINLHPVSVILAILVFGSIWGIWGIAFAIPMATFIKALIEYWPRVLDKN